MTDVLLVTCSELPAGEPGALLLDAALRDAGVQARWVAWDDAAIDWGEAPLVAVRSTWDYIDHHADFLAWARRVGEQAMLLNGADVFTWNTEKRYLLELSAAGVPVVPTWAVDRPEDLMTAVAEIEGRVVVKPRLGVSGIGLRVIDDADQLRDRALVGAGPWIVQPVIESVRTEGELSVFVFGGETSCAVRKLPGEGNILVHEEYGGRSVEVVLDDEADAVARGCVAAAEALLGTTLHYARVDLMRHEGQLVLSELEATEPGLYLDVTPANAKPFASLIQTLLPD